jgi:hypothetical protein
MAASFTMKPTGSNEAPTTAPTRPLPGVERGPRTTLSLALSTLKNESGVRETFIFDDETMSKTPT